jgi:hypothetical protein
MEKDVQQSITAIKELSGYYKHNELLH